MSLLEAATSTGYPDTARTSTCWRQRLGVEMRTSSPGSEHLRGHGAITLPAATSSTNDWRRRCFGGSDNPATLIVQDVMAWHSVAPRGAQGRERPLAECPDEQMGSPSI